MPEPNQREVVTTQNGHPVCQWSLPLGDGRPDLAVHLFSSSFDVDVFSKEDSVELRLEGAPLVGEEDTHSRIGEGDGTENRSSSY